MTVSRRILSWGFALIQGKGIWYVPLDVITAMTAITAAEMAVTQTMTEDIGGNLDLGEKEREACGHRNLKLNMKAAPSSHVRSWKCNFRFKRSSIVRQPGRKDGDILIIAVSENLRLLLPCGLEQGLI